MNHKIAEQIQKKVIECYGTKEQFRVLQEECGELIVAISHLLRKRESYASVIEEMADVTIVIEQFLLTMTPEAAELFEEFYDLKVERMAKRLGLRLP